MSRMFPGYPELVPGSDDVRFVDFERKRSQPGASAKQISGNIRDLSVADRLVPDFATTAEEGRIIAFLSISPQDWHTAV